MQLRFPPPSFVLTASAISSDNSAFSAFFSEKSAFSGGSVAAVGHNHCRFYELVDGPPFALSPVEVTEDVEA